MIIYGTLDEPVPPRPPRPLAGTISGTDAPPTPANIIRHKLRYIRQEILLDLHPRGWKKVEYWLAVMVFIGALWLRIYLHALGQWLMLYSLGVPVFSFTVRARSYQGRAVLPQGFNGIFLRLSLPSDRYTRAFDGSCPVGSVRSQNLAGGTESGQEIVWTPVNGRNRSGQEIFQIPRVGSGRPGPTQPDRREVTRPVPKP